MERAISINGLKASYGNLFCDCIKYKPVVSKILK